MVLARSAPASGQYECTLCDKSYDRFDHLNRHLSSHENSRSYRCKTCSKGYNRADLLHRHRLTHRRPSVELQKRAQRAAQACQSCILAKAKCSDEKPCSRCSLRALNCEIPASLSRNAHFGETADAASNDIPTAAPFTESGYNSCSPLEPACSGTSVASHAPDHLQHTINDTTVPKRTQMLDDTVTWPYPAFFDQLDQLDDRSHAESNTTRARNPPDVANFLEDIHFDFTDLDYSAIDLAMFGDLSNAERSKGRDIDTTGGPILSNSKAQSPTDNLMTTFADDQTKSSDSSPSASQAPHVPAVLRASRLRAGTEAFRRSPWAHWHPKKHQHAFSGQEEINVDNASLSTVDSPLSVMADSHVTVDNLDQGFRDRMLAVVHRVSISKFKVPSFPSLDVLNNLLRAFFAQENEAIAKHVHTSTLAGHNARPELVLALVASGATAIPLRTIQQMGLVIQEVVRVATAELYERDNSTVRELQGLQALLAWQELGAWSGVKRKAEIASAFIQPLHVLLTQLGAIGGAYYASSGSQLADKTTDIEAKWAIWVGMESMKRLVIRSFIHDSQVSMAFLQSPVFSYAQATLPVPESAESWLAADADTWKCSATPQRDESSQMSLTEVFSDLRVLDEHCGNVDGRLCCLAAVHAFANQAWELRQQSALLNYHRGERRKELYALFEKRREDLYKALTAARVYCERSTPHYEISFVIEYVMMSLFVSLPDVQAFAGKDGESEARRAVSQLKQWAQESSSRTAVWHAGQVFRMARCFPPSTLRGFYAIGLYHAALTLWVYSLIRISRGRHSGTQTPENASGQGREREAFSLVSVPANPASRSIRLDGAETLESRAFVMRDQGVPGLSYPELRVPSSYISNVEQGIVTGHFFRPLSQPKVVMEVATEILQNNLLFPNDSTHLVQNLKNLMTDLGSLHVS